MTMHSLIVVLACLALLVLTPEAKFDSDADIQLKALQAIGRFDAENIPTSKRALSIYYLANLVSKEDSFDVIENNVKIFAGAVLLHNSSSSTRRAFYIFNVVGGSENVFAKYLPYAAENTAFIKTPVQHNDLLAHVQLVSLLGETVISKFQSVFFMNHDARGPFIGRKNGAWWKFLTASFDADPRIALVGPVISCQIAPHVQTHAFAMRSDVVLEIFSEFNPRSAAGKRNKAKHIETALSTEAINAGYLLSSLHDQRSAGQAVFNNNDTCVNRTSREMNSNSVLYQANPTSWCDVKPSDAIFMKWGGPPLRLRGYYCQDTIDSIRAGTLALADREPALFQSLALPETIYGGRMYQLYKEHNQQLWLDRSVVPIPVRPSRPSMSRSSSGENANKQQQQQTESRGVMIAEASKVCLLVRTSLQQGKEALKNSRLVHTDIHMLIACKCLSFFVVHGAWRAAEKRFYVYTLTLSFTHTHTVL